MPIAAFVLTQNTDPEERLEEAALWKALFDEFGGDGVVAVSEHSSAPDGIPVFGRTPRLPMDCRNPVSSRLEYWKDPAFLAACGREFNVATFSEAERLVADLHSRKRGAFIKSTNLKHFTATIPCGTDFMRQMGAMAYSFIDGGPSLMVQEHVKVEYEYRYFVVGRRIVASSPNMISLTPIDFPLPEGTVYRLTSVGTPPEVRHDLVVSFDALAQRLCSEMAGDHACIDLALIDGRPGVVEMNPMQIGQVGLFASSVRDLAAAARELASSYVPSTNPVVTHGKQTDRDQEDYSDFTP